MACNAYHRMRRLLCGPLSTTGQTDIIEIINTRPYLQSMQRSHLLGLVLTYREMDTVIPELAAYLAYDAWDRALWCTESMRDGKMPWSDGLAQLQRLLPLLDKSAATWSCAAGRCIGNIHAAVHLMSDAVSSLHLTVAEEVHVRKDLSEAMAIIMDISSQILMHVSMNNDDTTRRAADRVMCMAAMYTCHRYGFIHRPVFQRTDQLGGMLLADCVGPALTTVPDEAAADIFIHIKRDDLVNSSLDAIRTIRKEEWQRCRTIDVLFDGESALGEGVVREWLGRLAHEVFRESPSLFVPLESNPALVHPVPCSSDQQKQLFYLAGHIIGLSLRLDIPIGVHLSSTMVKIMGSYVLGLEDLKEIDSDIYRSCKAILACEAEEMLAQLDGLTSTRGEDLFPGGHRVPVTLSNRAVYVQLLAIEVLMRPASAVTYIMAGIRQVLYGPRVDMALDILSRMSPQQLNELVGGMLPGQEVSMDQWREHVMVGGPGWTDGQIKVMSSAFFVAMEQMGHEARKRLLRFWTGLHGLPGTGLAGLEQKPHVVFRQCNDAGRLPSSHTCIMLMEVPVQPSDLEDSTILASTMMSRLHHAACEGIMMEDGEVERDAEDDGSDDGSGDVLEEGEVDDDAREFGVWSLDVGNPRANNVT